MCTIAGPPTSNTFFPAARVARIASTTPLTLTAFGFSLETVEFMKPNRLTSRDRSTGSTRTPAWPTTIGMPTSRRHIGTQRDWPAAGSTSDAAVHLLVVDVDPAAVDADLGRLVGRAVELLGERAGDIGRDDPGVLGMDRRGAVLDQVAQDRVERRRGSPAWIAIRA